MLAPTLASVPISDQHQLPKCTETSSLVKLYISKGLSSPEYVAANNRTSWYQDVRPQALLVMCPAMR